MGEEGQHHDIADPLEGIGTLTFCLWVLVIIPARLFFARLMKRKR